MHRKSGEKYNQNSSGITDQLRLSPQKKKKKEEKDIGNLQKETWIQTTCGN
jgi:hypothetical protein